MRLEPLPAAPSTRTRLLEWVAERALGKTTTPTRVVYRRLPRMWNVSLAFMKLTRSMTIGAELSFLLQARVANLRRCFFCEDIARAQAAAKRLGMERFNALAAWQDSSLFTEAERAALQLVDEASDLSGVRDATWQKAAEHWNDRQLLEITSLVAIESFYNAINLTIEMPADGLEQLASRNARTSPIERSAAAS